MAVPNPGKSQISGKLLRCKTQSQASFPSHCRDGDAAPRINVENGT
jgi:hypothetical protein